MTVSQVRLIDPIGPGSPAWDSFDAALEILQNDYTRHSFKYQNARRKMINLLHRANATISTIEDWKNDLAERAKTQDWGE